ncbi:E3 ubiquitin-protein ligase march2-like [Plakobranchus ocellatus]|uniref:E3 ubiquitin-protein ligase march2-like n=1 Tax=Plakobranchus ocellatus TaxID=259542 RepID=A0AAV4DVC7_9GAST|nr:E3 ubiquitin-protein ligase march2-like [Plakobranchus ocellatus]
MSGAKGNHPEDEDCPLKDSTNALKNQLVTTSITSPDLYSPGESRTVLTPNLTHCNTPSDAPTVRGSSVCASSPVRSETSSCRYLEEIITSPVIFASGDSIELMEPPECLDRTSQNHPAMWNLSFGSMKGGTGFDSLPRESEAFEAIPAAEISCTYRPCSVSSEELVHSRAQRGEAQCSALSEESACRICQEGGMHEKLVSPCLCSGTVGMVHVSCLNTWLQVTSRTSCELCGFPFPVTKRLASFREYLRHPRANMDLPNLLCDVACLTVLTPLLFSSVYLTSTGALRYESLGHAGSLFAVVVLLLALLLVYVSWASLAVVYHLRVWRAWQERNCKVSMLSEAQVSDSSVTKIMPSEMNLEMTKGIGSKSSSSHNTRGGPSYPLGGDTGVILAPINRLSGWMRVNNRVTSGYPRIA